MGKNVTMFETLLYHNRNLVFICNYKFKKQHLTFFTENENFKTFVIKSLVDITNRIKRCEFLLKKKQNNFSEQLENEINDTDENNILDEKFPMKSLDYVRGIEQQLQHDETFKKQLVSINKNIII